MFLPLTSLCFSVEYFKFQRDGKGSGVHTVFRIWHTKSVNKLSVVRKLAYALVPELNHAMALDRFMDQEDPLSVLHHSSHHMYVH